MHENIVPRSTSYSLAYFVTIIHIDSYVKIRTVQNQIMGLEKWRFRDPILSATGTWNVWRLIIHTSSDTLKICWTKFFFIRFSGQIHESSFCNVISFWEYGSMDCRIILYLNLVSLPDIEQRAIFILINQTRLVADSYHTIAAWVYLPSSRYLLHLLSI